MRTLLLVVLSFFVSACCCRPSVESQVRAMERENALLRFQVDATEQANQAARDYAAELAAGGNGEPLFSMYYSPGDLVRLGHVVFPYQIPARDFNSKLTGNIVVERIEAVQFLPGNKMTLRMHLKGQGVRYTGDVPDIAKAQVKSFQDGIAAGVVTNLDATLSLKGNTIEVMAHANDCKLKRNSNPSHERELCEQMNQKALRTPLRFDVSIEGNPARVKRVVLTQNHLVVSYQP